MRVASLAGRLIALLSLTGAIVTALWPLASRPGVVAALAAVVIVSAALARWRAGVATSFIFLFAYVGYGTVRAMAGPAVASMPFWLAAFTGLVIGSARWTRWQAGDGWRIPLVWWGVTVAVAWPFAFMRTLDANGVVTDASGQVVTAAILQIALALWMDRLLAPARDQRGMPGGEVAVAHWTGPLIASALVTACAAIYQWRIDPSWMSGEPWIVLGRTTGLMGDANPMGLAVALWAPLAWTLFGGGPAATALGVLLAVVLWTAAWLSGSRTTLILIAAGIAALIWVWMVARRVSAVRRIATLGAAAVALLLAMVLIGMRVPSSPLARLVSATPQDSASNVAYQMLWARDGYGLAAVQAIREHPIAGVGVGRFTSLSPAYHRAVTGRRVPPDNAQNLWRHTFAEQGLIGVLPLVWLTLLTARALVGGGDSSEERIMRAMVAALGVALLFGYAVQDAAIAVTVGTLVAGIGRMRADSR